MDGWMNKWMDGWINGWMGKKGGWGGWKDRGGREIRREERVISTTNDL